MQRHNNVWGGVGWKGWLGGYCMVISNASWVMVKWDSPMYRMNDWWTNTTENITFLKFSWRAVITFVWILQSSELAMRVCHIYMYVVNGMEVWSNGGILRAKLPNWCLCNTWSSHTHFPQMKIKSQSPWTTYFIFVWTLSIAPPIPSNLNANQMSTSSTMPTLLFTLEWAWTELDTIWTSSRKLLLFTGNFIQWGHCISNSNKWEKNQQDLFSTMAKTSCE